jgi:hypothetical protein
MAAHRAYLIDASIYIFRAWFSLPDQWYTYEGWPLNAVYGYTRSLAGLEQAVPGLDERPHFTLRADHVNELASYLERLNLRGPLTRRCETLVRSLAT